MKYPKIASPAVDVFDESGSAPAAIAPRGVIPTGATLLRGSAGRMFSRRVQVRGRIAYEQSHPPPRPVRPLHDSCSSRPRTTSGGPGTILACSRLSTALLLSPRLRQLAV